MELISNKSQRRTVVVLATLDTKGAEAAYLRSCIESAGLRAIVVDTGVVGIPQSDSEVTRQQVASAGGSSFQELLEHPDREQAAPVMAAGAEAVVQDLIRRDECHALLSLGGTQGTTLSTAVMRSLPYGFPKVMVSTMASGNVAPWVGTKDIVMFNSVTDILGLNRLSRRILANAAAAACGMANVAVELDEEDSKKTIAITTVGITTVGAMTAMEYLQSQGYETMVFHAVGSGGRAMEQMMEEGLIDGVLDYATIEISNYMFKALLDGGPTRLSTAGRLGIPQVICPGAIEVLVFNEPETVPAPFNTRKLVRHSPQITDVRLNEQEMLQVADEVSARLKSTTANAVFLAPTEGFDCYAVAGEPFHDPQADKSFLRRLKSQLPSTVEYCECSQHINEEMFARQAAETLVGLMQSSLLVGAN